MHRAPTMVESEYILNMGVLILLGTKYVDIPPYSVET